MPQLSGQLIIAAGLTVYTLNVHALGDDKP